MKNVGCVALGVAVSALVSATACGGLAAVDGDTLPSEPAGADAGGGGTGVAATADGGALGDGSAGGAQVHVRVRASTAPFPHADGLAGQTPAAQAVGIRRLTLSRGPSDPSPLVVFDLGAAGVEVALDDGADTEVATVRAAALSAGHYTTARVTVSHVRYRVAATMHAMGQHVPGVFDNVQVLSDGSTVDGQTRNKGHYRFAFEALGTVLGTKTGEDAPLPATATSGDITLDTSGPESAYVFPVSLRVDPALRSDVAVVFEVNTHESFRWSDQPGLSYAAGAFDVTDTSFEPVERFGANQFRVVTEAAP